MERTCVLRLTRHYPAAPADVWAALTQPASLERWLGAMAGPGRTSVRGQDDGRLLELDWLPPGEEPSIVRFELRGTGEGTTLVVDHRLEARAGMRAMARWEPPLERLDALLAGPR